MNHFEYQKGTNLAVPCTAAYITFGGHCLNCGYRPETTKTAVEESRYHLRMTDPSYDAWLKERGL